MAAESASYRNRRSRGTATSASYTGVNIRMASESTSCRSRQGRKGADIMYRNEHRSANRVGYIYEQRERRREIRMAAESA